MCKNIRDTTDEIKEKLLTKFKDIIILTDDIRIRKPIFYKFKQSDILYTNVPYTMLQDGFKNFKRYWNTSIYKNELKEKNPAIECVSKYISYNKKILHHCKVHDRDFMIDPSHALRGQGCINCKGQKIGNAKRKPVEEYLLQLKKVHSDIILTDEYISVNKPTKHKCLKCNYEWHPYPINLLHGEGCPNCTSSFGEQKILNILSKYNIKNQRQYRIPDCKNKKPLPFDFAILNKDNSINFLIEYQGRQHYTPSQFGNIDIERAKQNLELCQYRDTIKSNYCYDNKIDLLIIPYTEFENIDSIVFNKLCDKKLITQ